MIISFSKGKQILHSKKNNTQCGSVPSAFSRLIRILTCWEGKGKEITFVEETIDSR